MAHDTATKQGNRLEKTVVEFLPEYLDLFKNLPDRLKKGIKQGGTYKGILNRLVKLANGEPFFVQHIALCESIYNVPWFSDLLIWHPELFKNGAIMEIKQQSTAGSVDEKYPFVVQSLIKISSEIDGPTVLFVSGGAVRQCALDWCRREEALQRETNFVFITDEAGLRHFLKTGKKKSESFSRNKKSTPSEEFPDWMR